MNRAQRDAWLASSSKWNNLGLGWKGIKLLGNGPSAVALFTHDSIGPNAPALKEVVISIQTEIIQALNLARAVENAVLDFTAIHTLPITAMQVLTLSSLPRFFFIGINFLPVSAASCLASK